MPASDCRASSCGREDAFATKDPRLKSLTLDLVGPTERLARSGRLTNHSELLGVGAYNLLCSAFARAHNAFHEAMHLRGVFASSPVNAPCRFAQCASVIRENAGGKVSDHSPERPFLRCPVRFHMRPWPQRFASRAGPQNFFLVGAERLSSRRWMRPDCPASMSRRGRQSGCRRIPRTPSSLSSMNLSSILSANLPCISD
jgi:hypothetical protein